MTPLILLSTALFNLTDQHCAPAAPTIVESRVESITDWRRAKLNSDSVPRVKVLLCGNDCDYFAAADLKCSKVSCLKYIDGVHIENVRIHSGCGPIGKEFDWFFDPKDIAPGGLLLLCVTGHGIWLKAYGYLSKTPGLAFSASLTENKKDLHTAINKIQVPCTLEVVLGTCNSEAAISGLERLLVMEASRASYEAQNVPPPPDALFKSIFSNRSVPKLTTAVTIIIWAAAVDGGSAYEEEDLPGRKGKNDIMIGRLLAKPFLAETFYRKSGAKAVTKYNTARDKEHLGKTGVEQYNA
ncbi:hypothetical protein B0J17DRAFT_722551 [Rhizoctonia solani]|nr:hypothetical protein B0J17DRAFT_722551 [Rhizoctonia solani]